MATVAPLPSVVEIVPSADELAQACLGQRSVQSALEALHRDGIVVVKDVVDHTAIDRLNRHMMDDTRTLMDRGENGPFNYNLGNLQQSPPYDPSLMSPSIFMNPFAIQLTNAWLGSRPTLSFISSNAAVKAEHGQPVHSDADFSHPSVSVLQQKTLKMGLSNEVLDSLRRRCECRFGGHEPSERLNS